MFDTETKKLVYEMMYGKGQRHVLVNVPRGITLAACLPNFFHDIEQTQSQCALKVLKWTNL